MSRSIFFRQSGWMIAATGIAGGLVLLVPPILTKPADFLPFVRKPITGAEFGLFQALVALVSLLNILSNGVQSIFAHQTASATTPELERQLRGTVRKVLAGLAAFWVLVVILTFIFQQDLLRDFKVYHPASLWATMLIGLPVLWLPVLCGILQGKQNFKWLGFQSILNSLARCIAIFVFVRLIGVHVTGAMAGVLAGSCTSLAICIWQASPLLRGPADPIEWRAWLRRVVPLVCGVGAVAFMVSADMVFVRRFLPEEQSGLYSAVAVIGRALMFLIFPMTQVMFPKVVQAAARSETTDAMTHALGATALIGSAAAFGCTLFPELPLRILFSPEYLPARSLVWVYAWCMVPMTLAIVLINNLMARQHFASVPWLVAVALGYGVTLALVASRMQTSPSMEAFRAIVLTFGVFSVLMLAITIGFTLKKR